jgi:predicted GIY-YIG superfamily endonuclease
MPSSPGLTGRSSIPETADGGTQLLRLHPRQSHRRYAYIGVTNDLIRRVSEHRLKLAKGFTKKYEVGRLVYFEQFNDAENAIRREKRLKKWNRAWKIRLIESRTPIGMICIQV